MNDLIATIYEGFGIYDGTYSDYLFKEQYYTIIGYILFFAPFALIAIFYYAIDFVFGKLWHWLLYVLVTTIISSITIYLILSGQLVDYIQDEQYSDVNIFINDFTLLSFAYALILCIGYTFLLKNWSSNNRKNPI